MQEISNLPVYTGIIPNKAAQSDNDFANNIFGFLNYSGNTFVVNFNTIIGQFNILSGQINTAAEQVSQDKQIVLEAKDITLQAKEDAEIAKNAAAAIYDNFDDRYLGTKSTPPTLDNDGEALRQGALYCKESTNPAENGLMYVYDSQLGDWINLSFIPTLFASLTDVLFSGLDEDHILKYDAALGKWKNIPRDYYNKNEIDNNIYTKAQMNNILLSVISAGTVIAFANSSVPTGFLECNGALLSRTTYADLFAVIGTTYGVGDGSTTFAIPDLRGEFIRGFDNGKGTDSGRTIGSSQSDAYGSHSHTGSTNSTGAHTHAVDVGADIGGTNYVRGSGGSYQTSKSTSSAGTHSHTVTINASGSTETRPRNIAMMYCIKY
ncbi:MAG: phage tail protein [Arcobacter sp.]|uniref:phage tail protein n=1 Tax=Arcobacter sp. TaxID=1872629 RepID=UPI003D018BB2